MGKFLETPGMSTKLLWQMSETMYGLEYRVIRAIKGFSAAIVTHCIHPFLSVLYRKPTLLLQGDGTKPAGLLNTEYRDATENAPFYHIPSVPSIR